MTIVAIYYSANARPLSIVKWYNVRMKFEKHFVDFLLSNLPLWYVTKQYDVFLQIHNKSGKTAPKIEDQEIAGFYEYLQKTNFTDMMNDLEE